MEKKKVLRTVNKTEQVGNRIRGENVWCHTRKIPELSISLALSTVDLSWAPKHNSTPDHFVDPPLKSTISCTVQINEKKTFSIKKVDA